MERSTHKPSKNAARLSKGKKRVPAAANPKPLSSSAAIPEATSTVAKKNKHEMTPIGDGTIELGEFMSESNCVANEKKESVQRIDEIKSTDVSGDLEEKGKNYRKTKEKSLGGCRLLEALKEVQILLKEVPTDKMTEDVKVLLRNHLQLVTHCLKGEQGNCVSSTAEVSPDQGNKIGGGRNDAVICEGTYEVERYVDTISLDDLVKICTPTSQEKPNDYQRKLEWLKKTAGTVELVVDNGRPSPLLLKLMRNILREVFKLHDKGKAHGHLCPENILIFKESRETELKKGLHYYAKLRPGSSCLKSSKTGCEQCTKNPGSPTLREDINSLGEIFYYCITGRTSNEWKTEGNKRDLSAVACPAAKDLISCLQKKSPGSRSIANELQYHPLFWTPEERLSFLHAIMNMPSYSKYFELWKRLQKLSVHEVTGGEWNEHIRDNNVLRHIEGQNTEYKQNKNLPSKQNKKKARKYNFDNVLDLVLLIRNMNEHYRDLPPDVQESVREPPEDFDSFFTRRFPNLVIEVYKVVRNWRKGKEDKHFRKYFDGGALVGY